MTERHGGAHRRNCGIRCPELEVGQVGVLSRGWSQVSGIGATRQVFFSEFAVSRYGYHNEFVELATKSRT